MSVTFSHISDVVVVLSQNSEVDDINRVKTINLAFFFVEKSIDLIKSTEVCNLICA